MLVGDYCLEEKRGGWKSLGHRLAGKYTKAGCGVSGSSVPAARCLTSVDSFTMDGLIVRG